MTIWILAMSIAAIVVLVARLRVHPALALLGVSLASGLALGLSATATLKTIQDGFGSLLGQIGLTVVLGTLLGQLLERSGAALRLALAVLQLAGPNRPGWAVAAIGYLVGIPVFCDSGFVLVSRLHAGLHARSGVGLPTLAVALSSGVFATHTLVPPTPGPIAAAGNLGLGEGLAWVMLFGALVALPATVVGALYAHRLGAVTSSTVAQDEAPAQNAPTLPSLAGALLPMAVPVLLIALGVVVPQLGSASALSALAAVLGHPLVALSIGCLLCAALMWGRRSEIAPAIERGVTLSGPILIITACGGAFGAVLKATPLATELQAWAAGSGAQGPWFLLLAFAVAALFKTAQGSTTAAMAIASSLLGGLVAAAGFNSDAERAVVVCAIGAGAMVVSHVNDSYYWIVTQFGSIAPAAGLRTQTVATGLMGVAALVATLLLYAALQVL